VKTRDRAIQKRTEPAFIEPMQCKPVTSLPSGEKWTFEIKFDGYRCIAVKRAREVTLFSRHERVLNRRFPGVVWAIASFEGDFVLDGELVALDSQGMPSFQILQNIRSQSRPIYCYVFDLLYKNGELLIKLPLSRRRELVEDLLAAPKDPLRLSPLFHAPADQILEAVRKLGLEGVVGKRIDSEYEPGGRSGAWLKFRTNMEQEFVIGLHPWSSWVRRVTRRRLREEGTHLRREGEEWLRVTNPGRSLLDAQGVANCPVPVQEAGEAGS
jgi:bifunctional non-homologous end joining protein LigD